MNGSKYKDYFTRVDPEHVRCDLCFDDSETRIYKLKTGSSTSCLRGHLKKVHNIEVPNLQRNSIGTPKTVCNTKKLLFSLTYKQNSHQHQRNLRVQLKKHQ